MVLPLCSLASLGRSPLFHCGGGGSGHLTALLPESGQLPGPPGSLSGEGAVRCQGLSLLGLGGGGGRCTGGPARGCHVGWSLRTVGDQVSQALACPGVLLLGQLLHALWLGGGG